MNLAQNLKRKRRTWLHDYREKILTMRNENYPYQAIADEISHISGKKVSKSKIYTYLKTHPPENSITTEKKMVQAAPPKTEKSDVSFSVENPPENVESEIKQPSKVKKRRLFVDMEKTHGKPFHDTSKSESELFHQPDNKE